MEGQQPNYHEQPNDKSTIVCNNRQSNSNSSSSSSRWTPTTEQIRILKELYYNNGVRSPSAEQIQRISARLRQYGKIEGKNVFYWFQNHKARERQKKRFMATAGTHDHPHQYHPIPMTNNYPTICSGVSSPSSSSGMIGVGQMGSNGGYGYVTMEKSFMDCSISPAVGARTMGHSFGWAGVDSYTSTYPIYDNKNSYNLTLEDEQQEEQVPEIETLPLFPMHGDHISGFCGLMPESDTYYDTKASSRTSLELRLNSFAGWSPDCS